MAGPAAVGPQTTRPAVPVAPTNGPKVGATPCRGSLHDLNVHYHLPALRTHDAMERMPLNVCQIFYDCNSPPAAFRRPGRKMQAA